MKKKLHSLHVHSRELTKFLLIMRISTLLFLISTLSVSASVYSQTQKLNLTQKDATIRQVFDEIEKQTSYKFFYLNEQIDDKRVVDMAVNNVTVEEVLEKMFDQNKVKYKVFENNLVVISPLFAAEASKQQQKVTGTITDATTNEALVGVNIVIEGTTIGTVTDVSGNFTIETPNTNATLIISYIGYNSEKVSIAGRSTITVQLVPDITKLDEVVVIGYGTQKKGDITSSIATVKADNFIKGSITDAGQLIQGKVAGLTIIAPTGNPSDQTQILLRGSTSLMGKNQNPLILIDGIPGDMKSVATQDIESVDVLKDGSAAAIYGTRGNNGVILITTKKAGNNKGTVEYSTYVSTQTIYKKPNLSTAADFRAQIASGDRVVIADDGTKTYPMTDHGASTDWLKELLQTPLTQSHNLTFRNGTATTNYLVNLNYTGSEGIFKRNYNQMFSGHIDFNHSMFNNKVKINVNLFSSADKYDNFNDNSIYYQVLQQNPTSPVRDSTGHWYQELSKFGYQNPISDLNERDGMAKDVTVRYKGAIEYTPFTGLKLSSIFSYGKRSKENGYSETKQNATTLRDNKNGYANFGGEENIDRLIELTAEYTKSINKHNFKVLGGYSYQENDYNSFFMENWNFPTDQFGYSNIGLGQAVVNGDVTDPVRTSRTSTNLVGFFGRLSYNYNEKYLFMASVRREEASQLWGTNNAWGTFPAVSVGWRITKESFMSGQNLFNDIKLRAGYGVTGSQPSDPFRGVGVIDYTYGYVYSNGKWVKSLAPSQNANPDLKWEEKREADFGLDFSMLNDRIGGSIDYYNRQIHNLLDYYSVPSPPNLYNLTLANVGVMENKGLEIMLNFVPVKTNDFQWNTDVSYSTNSNKLKSISNDIYKASSDYLRVGAIFPPIQTFSHLLKAGGPVGDFYGYKVIDIGNDPSDKDNYGKWIYEGADPTKAAQLGQPVKYSDFGHAFEDKQVIGNGLPKFYIGWNNSFRYKNFDLNITQRGAFKFQVANLTRMMFENPKMMQYNVLNNAFDKVYGKTQLRAAPEFNSYYIENGDFWKIDNITLGYNLKKTGIKYIQSARLYVSVRNAFIFTGYKGLDPEVSLRNGTSYAQSGVVQTPTSGLDPGMDDPHTYPTTRTFSVGLNVTF